MQPNRAILCIGSNTADRQSNIDKAVDALRPFCRVIAQSGCYEFPDDSGIGKPYINAVICCEPNIRLEDFQNELKDLEANFGRTSQSKLYGNMPLDIDIVVWNDRIIDPFEYSRPYFRKGYSDLLQKSEL